MGSLPFFYPWCSAARASRARAPLEYITVNKTEPLGDHEPPVVDETPTLMGQVIPCC